MTHPLNFEHTDDFAPADLFAVADELVATARSIGILDQHFWIGGLDRREWAFLQSLPEVPPAIRRKLKHPACPLTVVDAGDCLRAIAASLPLPMPLADQVVLILATRLISTFQKQLEHAQRSPQFALQPLSAATDRHFQIRIQILGLSPPIWRLVELPDCTLDELHGQIQAALGWKNSHLHAFQIDGRRYANPAIVGPELEIDRDSTRYRLSDLFPATGGPRIISYTYDFGDGWLHEVQYEGDAVPNETVEYPHCVAGARACPPEDCGGPHGYDQLLRSRKQSARFRPEKFEAADATKRMRKWLPTRRTEPANSRTKPRRSPLPRAPKSMTAIIEVFFELAKRSLQSPSGKSSPPAFEMALHLAHAAWNESLGLPPAREKCQTVWRRLMTQHPESAQEFSAPTVDALIDNLISIRQQEYPVIRTRIHQCKIENGKVALTMHNPVSG